MSLSLVAQVSSPLDRFTISFDAGCAPFTVNVESLIDVNVPVGYFYEDGLDLDEDTFYTYNFPGSYELIQLVGGNIVPNLDTLPITVYEPTLPELRYSFCNPSEVHVEIIDSIYDSYEIRVANGNTLLKTDSSLSAVLFFNPGDPRDVQIEGFFNDALDNCGETSTTVITRDLINDIFITDYRFEYVCDDEFNLLLSYQQSSNTRFEVEFSENGTSFQSLYDGFLDSTFQSFSNISVSDNASQLCFRVNAISECDNTRIAGQVFCEQFIPNSGALDNAYATYIGDDIQLRFDQNPFGDYVLEKVVDDEIIDLFSPVGDGFIDGSISPLRFYQYNIVFAPNCEAGEQRVTVAAPKIDGEKISPNRYRIDWREGTNNLDGPPFEYQLLIINSDSSNVISINNPENPEFINLTRELGIDQDVMLVGDNGSGISILSNPLKLNFEWVVYVPEAFTPNQDGVNDVLEVFGLPSEDFSMKIYNRWGQVVFVTENINDFWDGKLKNGSIREGAYLYEIEFLNEEGEIFRQQGNFVLLKK